MCAVDLVCLSLIARAALNRTSHPRFAASVPGAGLPHGVADFGATVRAFVDEVDLRHAPVRLDVSHIHWKQPDAAGTNHRGGLDVMMLNIGWHFGSLLNRKAR